MFDSLILSNPRRKKTQGVSGTITSTVVHGILIASAVVATSNPDQVTREVDRDTTIIVFPSSERQNEPEPKEPPSRQIVRIQPLPEGFRTVPSVVDVPTEIPPIDVTPSFDPRDYTGRGAEGGIFDGIRGRSVLVDPMRPLLASAADEPPERIGGPTPRYPDMLRQVGLEGIVMLQFVIDTTGRVEPASLVVISATHRAFEGPARETALRSRYRPARVRGTPVRVLVQQSIAFSIR